LDVLPLADGGPGTVEVLRRALGGERREAWVQDPLGRKVRAEWGWCPPGLAVIEMSAASGLWRLAQHERAPREASTFGTGELIRAALEAGCSELLLGAGGSATNDGGAGALFALGARALDVRGAQTLQVERAIQLDLTGMDHRLMEITLTLATDVNAPLLGPTGATRVFGPQKGASAADLETLERRMEHWAELLETATGRRWREQPGAGAAGGLAFGLMALLAQVRSGFEVIAERTGLRARILECDRVLTGEGRFDAQTALGKGPWRLTQMAQESGRPTTLFAGSVGPEVSFEPGELVLLTPPGAGDGQAEDLLEATVARWAEKTLRP